MKAIMCPKQNKPCYFDACEKAGECLGAPCPHDKQYCALSACVKHNICQHDSYYVAKDNAGAQVVPVKAITADAKLAPATIPVAQAVTKTKPCHYGMHMLLKTATLELWVGGEKDIEACTKSFDLMISLKGPPRIRDEFQSVVVTASENAKRELPAALFPKPPMALYVDWPDFGVPRLNEEWWQALVEYLTSKPMRVAMFCMAGHGRTGTAAAILLSLLGVLRDEDDPVEIVRQEYCDQTVESGGQIQYIREITGRAVFELPRDFMSHHDWHHDDYWRDQGMVAGSATNAVAASVPAPTPPMSKNQEKKLRKKLAVEAAARAVKTGKG